MKITSILVLFFLFISETCFCQDSLCQHITDGNIKAKGIKISLTNPCAWAEVESKSPDQIFKFLKKDDESKVLTSVSLDIRDLPNGLNSTAAKNFLKPEGLNMLSDGSGEIVSSKSLTVDKIIGGQIIRKDAAHNFYKIFNYFIYKDKLISITYFGIFGSEVNTNDYFVSFDTLLMKTKFK